MSTSKEWLSKLCWCLHTMEYDSLCVLSHFRLLTTPWTIACQVLLSVEFAWQEYWSGLPFPPPGHFPDPGIEPVSLVPPALAGGLFTTAPLGRPMGYEAALKKVREVLTSDLESSSS